MSLTIYTRFSDSQIFSDPLLNIFCNQMYTFLINKLGENTVIDNLLVDGSVALYLQEESIGKVYTIKFSTYNKELFDIIRASVTSLDISGFSYYENLVTMRINNSIVEIALLESTAVAVDYNGIKLLSKNQILKP